MGTSTMNGEGLPTSEWVDLGLPPGTAVAVHGLATVDDHLVAAVVTTPPGSPGRREALILRTSADGVGGWQEVYRTPLPSDWVEVAGEKRRLTVAQGFYGFASWSLPAAAPGSVLTALVSVQGSALIELNGAATVRMHPNRSPESGTPPLGRLLGGDDRLIGLSAGARGPLAGTTPTGSGLRAYQTRDPSTGPWQPLWPADAGPVPSFCGLAIAGGRLYAAAADPLAGFALWCADLSGGDVPAWSRLLDQGAFRYTLNAAVSAMTTDADDRVYLATVAAAAGSGLGNHGPEILRVDPDGGWEIIVGESRFTPHGWKRPLSGLGPGFGDRRAAALTRLLSLPSGLVTVHQRLAAATMERPLGAYSGATTIWSSADGIDWVKSGPVAMPALGEVQASAETKRGLLLGGSGVASGGGGTGAHARVGSHNVGSEPGALLLLRGF